MDSIRDESPWASRGRNNRGKARWQAADRPRIAHGRFTGSSRTACVQPTDSSWAVFLMNCHGHVMGRNNPQTVRGQPMDSPQIAPGSPSRWPPPLMVCYCFDEFAVYLTLSPGICSHRMPMEICHEDCPWAVRGLFVGWLYSVCGISVGCPWAILPIDVHLKKCPWAIRGLSAGYPWTARGLSVGCLQSVRRLFFPWDTHGDPWLYSVCGLSVGCSRAVRGILFPSMFV